MGRPPTVDRAKVLDLAEDLLLRGGTGALTIDAVAKAAGISKGGVQSCFGTKDALIGAMIERWVRDYDRKLAAAIGPHPLAADAVRWHVEATMTLDAADRARAAGLMATLIDGSHHRAECKAWYAERFGALDPRSRAGQRAQIALLATEGAFILRSFGLMDFTDDEWRTFGDGLHALLRDDLQERDTE